MNSRTIRKARKQAALRVSVKENIAPNPIRTPETQSFRPGGATVKVLIQHGQCIQGFLPGNRFWPRDGDCGTGRIDENGASKLSIVESAMLNQDVAGMSVGVSIAALVCSRPQFGDGRRKQTYFYGPFAIGGRRADGVPSRSQGCGLLDLFRDQNEAVSGSRRAGTAR